MRCKAIYTLRGLRESLNLNPKEMAERVGISEDTWRNYESYDLYPDIIVVNKIESISGVNYNDINFYILITVKP